jgi:hypothetical protein
MISLMILFEFVNIEQLLLLRAFKSLPFLAWIASLHNLPDVATF